MCYMEKSMEKCKEEFTEFMLECGYLHLEILKQRMVGKPCMNIADDKK